MIESFNREQLLACARGEMFGPENGKLPLLKCVAAAEHLKSRLGVGFNETTADGCVTLKESECMGACGDAPVMLVNNVRMCSFMQPEQIDRLLGECK